MQYSPFSKGLEKAILRRSLKPFKMLEKLNTYIHCEIEEGYSSYAKFTPSSSFANCLKANTENFVNVPDIFCIFNEAKYCSLVFCKFLKDFKF